MNRKFLNVILCGALCFSAATFSSCKDYDEDIEGLDNRITVLENKVKVLQNQLEDAVANGCWIEYYEIDQATGNCTLHFQGKTETLTIPSIEGKDATIRHFKVNNGKWQIAQKDGTYTNVVSVTGKTISVTKDEDGNVVLGNIVIRAVETEDMGIMQVVYIGEVETTIHCDKNDPVLAVDEENKYMVISVGGVHYTLLLEGSVFKGLQSISYRRVCAFDDYIEALTLINDQGEAIISSPARVSFRVLPADFKLEQAKFSCADLRKLKTRATQTALTYIHNTAKLEDGVLSLSLQPENMENDVYFGAVLNVELNGYTTSSDDFVVKKSEHKVSEAKIFNATTGTAITEPIIFDEKSPLYLNTIRCGFEVGRYNKLESLDDLGFDVVITYELDEKCKENFTVGEDENGTYLAVNPIPSENKGEVTVKYTDKNTNKVLLVQSVSIEAKSIDILLAADEYESTKLESISSLHTKTSYIKLSTSVFTSEEINSLFDNTEKLKVGYVNGGKLNILNENKVYVTRFDGNNITNSLYLFVDKQIDLDQMTGSSNRKPFDMYLIAANGGVLQVNTNDGVKRICLKKVNFYYQPYIKVRVGLEQEYQIFDNGQIENDVDDINNMPGCTIKGKAIIGRIKDEDNYSFANIQFSELYDWSPEDYVIFSIRKEDQTDFLQSEWGKSFIYETGGFSVKKPCNLRKLNFGNDQKAEKDGSGNTIQNTDLEMRKKGGNEGLKICYQVGDKEVLDNWYFLDPISSPSDQWFRFHYRFNLKGADKIRLYEGVGMVDSEIDLLKCMTNITGLNDNDKMLLQAFTSNLCHDWYFADENGNNNIVSVIENNDNSVLVVSDWATKRYGNIKVSLVGPYNNKDNFATVDNSDNLVVKCAKEFKETQFKIKITTELGEQEALFKVKK